MSGKGKENTVANKRQKVGSTQEDVELLEKVSEDPGRSFEVLEDLYTRLKRLDPKEASTAMAAARNPSQSAKARVNKTLDGCFGLVEDPGDDSDPAERETIGSVSFSVDGLSIEMSDLRIGDVCMSQWGIPSTSSVFGDNHSFEMNYRICKESETGVLHVYVADPSTGEPYEYPRAEFCTSVEPEDLSLPRGYDSMLLV